MTGTTITPYLFFSGRCEEALGFYRKALGAEVEMLMRHDESPTPPPPGMLQAGFEKKVMHASFRVGGVPLMASDGRDDKSRFGAAACARGSHGGGRPPGVRRPGGRRKHPDAAQQDVLVAVLRLGHRSLRSGLDGDGPPGPGRLIGREPSSRVAWRCGYRWGRRVDSSALRSDKPRPI